MAIVDNYVYSFSFHLDNGIPVVPFFGEDGDSELLKVMNYFDKIRNTEDFRIQNKKAFKFSKIFKSPIESFIKYYTYENMEESESEMSSDTDSEDGRLFK